ncbi:MAG TPA: hypothetical protein VG028_02560 [Terriglobia bacterium]|nr:hypothetical protein [Terriglobia bacterium]
MMFSKEAEALAYAEPLVPKRYHAWLRVLTQWKNDKERNGESDRWVKYFCPYFTTEGLLGKLNWAWDDARRVAGADGQKLVRIVTAWHVEGQYLVWSAEVETEFGLATGHATANLEDNAKGVDAKNPFENGETSAIGRTLRHLEYGFGFETEDEPSVAEGSNGHAEEAGAPPSNGCSTDKPKNGNGAATIGGSSNVAPPFRAAPAGLKPGATVETQPRAEGPNAKCASGNGHGPAADFNQLRNEVLTLARRLSSTSKQDIAAVVSRASDGSFQYSDIGRMTPADLPKLQAASHRLKEVLKQSHA